MGARARALQRPVLPSLWCWALACAACSDPAAAPPAKAAQAAACLAVQRTASNACCPPGHVWSDADKSCAAVGPPECASTAVSAPDACVPRWCWDWQRPDGDPCGADDAECLPIGRLCTAIELAAGQGCPAGRAPLSPVDASCRAAGSFAGSAVASDADLESAPPPEVPTATAALPPDVAPVDPLPPLADTYFCQDAAGQRRFCTAADACAGQADRSPSASPACLHAGVPWPGGLCPPGFVVAKESPGQPGEMPACVPDPADCGSDDYGDATLQDGMGVLFVNAATGKDGNLGTRKLPLKSMFEGLQRVHDGEAAALAVAAGTYAGSFEVSFDVLIRGRCAAMVKFQQMATVPVAIAVHGGKASQVAVRGVTVSSPTYGIQVWGSAKLALDRVWIDGTFGAGLDVADPGSGAVVKHSVIANIHPMAGDQTIGRGLLATDGASISLEHVRISRCKAAGIAAFDAGTQLTGTAVLIDGIAGQLSDGQFGDGLIAIGGAAAKLTQARISRCRQAGVLAMDAGTHVALSSAVIDGTRAQQVDGELGLGIAVQDGATMQLDGVRVSDNQLAGVAANGQKTALVGTLLVIDGTQSDPSQQFGNGLDVHEGAAANLNGLRLSANRNVALTVYGQGSVAQIAGLIIDGTLGEAATGEYGRAIDTQTGGRLQLVGARLTGNRDIGLMVDGTGTTVTAAQLLVDHMLPQLPKNDGGAGISVQRGGRLELADSRISGSYLVGISAVQGGSLAVARRVVIDAMHSQQSDGAAGMGVAAQNGGQIVLLGARISAARGIGVVAEDKGSVVAGAGVLVDGTLGQQKNPPFGRGVGVQQGGTVRLFGSAVVGSREVGIAATQGYGVQLAGVLVARTDVNETGKFGSGVLLNSMGGSAQVVATRIVASHSAAIGVHQSAASFTHCVLARTAPATYPKTSADGTPNGTFVTFADGLVATSCPALQLDGLLVAANPRAGLLIKQSKGVAIANTYVSGGFFGLAVEGMAVAAAKDSRLVGSDQNVASDLGLFVPAPPQAVFGKGN